MIIMKKLVYPVMFALLLMSMTAAAQTKETRNVGTFTKISFRFSGKLYLKQGSPQKVELQGDKDVLSEVETEVEGSRLIIGHEGKWNWGWKDDKEIIAYVTVADIEGVSVSGSGDVIGQGLIKTGDLDLNVSGSGNLEIEVEATGDVDADVSGSGDIDLKGRCKGFNSDVSGSGKVVLSMIMSDLADFGVSGSGKISASGSAPSVKTNISGSGKVLASDFATNSCQVRISGSGDVEINVKNELDVNIAGSGSVSYKGNPSKINSHASGSGTIRKF
jgi:hypothetical protein